MTSRDIDRRRWSTIQKAWSMHMIAKFSLIGTLVLLAACGRSQPGRVEGAAATGAATGATVGLIGGPIGVGAGAVIGGGVGAVAGATTSPKQVNLGKPVWQR
jgi:osmotically inducible lipoprotein OsmB